MLYFILDNNLITRAPALTRFLAKELYTCPNIKLLFFMQQFTEMMGVSIKKKQETVQKYYNKDIEEFQEAIEEEFNSSVDLAHIRYRYIPKALKKASAQFIQDLTTQSFEKAYCSFVESSKVCINTFKDEKEHTLKKFLLHYKASCCMSGSASMKQKKKNEATVKFNSEMPHFQKQTKKLLHQGTPERDIKYILYSIVQGILGLQESKEIDAFVKSLIQYNAITENFLDLFDDALEQQDLTSFSKLAIHYTTALLGADFSENGNAELVIEDENSMEAFLKESELTTEELAQAYALGLDINDMMLLYHAKKSGAIFLSSNTRILSEQINKIPKLATFFSSVTILLCNPGNVSLFIETLKKYLTPDGSTCMIPQDHDAIPGETEPLLQEKIEIQEEERSKNDIKSISKEEKEADLLEEILSILVAANQHILPYKTYKKFRKQLEKSGEDIYALHSLVKFLHTKKHAEILTHENTETFISKKEHLGDFKKIIRFLFKNKKELFTSGNIQNTLDVIEYASVITTATQLLFKQGILNQELYNVLILSKQYADEVAHSLLFLHQQDPTLLTTAYCKIITEAGPMAKKMALFIVELYKKDKKLLHDSIINRLFTPKDPISFTEAIFLLYTHDKRMLCLETYKALIAAQENAINMAHAIIQLWDEKPQLTNSLLLEPLVLAAADAEKMAYFIVRLHQKGEKFLLRHALLLPTIAKNLPTDVDDTLEALWLLFQHHNNFMNKEMYCFLNNCKGYVKTTTSALLLLFKTDEQLATIAIFHNLIEAKHNALSFANFIIQLYRKDKQLPFHPEILKLNSKLIPNDTSKIVPHLFSLYTEDKKLLTTQVCEALIHSQERVALITNCILLLYRKNVSLINNVILDSLLRSRDNAKDLTEILIGFFDTHKAFLNNPFLLFNGLGATFTPKNMAAALLLLDEKDKSLLLDQENITLLSLTPHACEVAKGLILLKSTSLTLLTKEIRSFLVNAKEYAEDFASSLILLYNKDPELIQHSCLTALGLAGPYTLKAAHFILDVYQQNKQLAYHPNIFKIHPLKIPSDTHDFIEAMDVLWMENKEILNTLSNYEFLIVCQNQAKIAATALLLLYKTDPKLLHIDITRILMRTGPHLLSMTHFIVNLYQKNEQLPFHPGILHFNPAIVPTDTTDVVTHLFSLYTEDPTLLTNLSCVALIQAKEHAERVASCIIALYRKNRALINNTLLRCLLSPKNTAIELTEIFIYLDDHHQDLLQHQLFLFEGLSRASTPKNMLTACLLLHKEAAHLLDRENIHLLRDAGSHVVEAAKGLVFIYKSNPNLLTQENRNILVSAQEHAETVALALVLLYTNVPSLITSDICTALVQSGVHAFLLAEKILKTLKLGIAVKDLALETLLKESTENAPLEDTVKEKALSYRP